MVSLLGSLLQLDNGEMPPILLRSLYFALRRGLLESLHQLDNMGGSNSSSSEVRIKHSLNKEEEDFVARRRKTVLKSLRKLQIYHDWTEVPRIALLASGAIVLPGFLGFLVQLGKDAVPNIALLGSGGGQRAMVGLLGSLVQLDKAGLLDCILYLSGVSGSTWCMASLYQEPNWSTKLETVKDQIIKRLNGPKVSWGDAFAKLKKYYYEKDLFSLTDLWAAIVVTSYVKEIDECKLSEQRDQHNTNPFPIYTVIDKHCKQQGDGDPWFEISPLEAGYSLIGEFVDTCDYGSQYDNGSKKKQQPEMDMLYLQALCGSALADEDEIYKFLWKKIKDVFNNLILRTETGMFEEIGKDKCYQVLMDLTDMNLAVLNGIDPSCLDQSIRTNLKDPNSPPVDKCYQVLMDLTDMNLAVLNGIDPSALDQSIRTNLKELAGGKRQLVFPVQKLDLTDKEASKRYMQQYTMDVCNYLSSWFCLWPFDKCYQVLMDLTDMNLAVLNGIDPSALDQSIRTNLKELAGGKRQLVFPVQKLDLTDKEASKRYMQQYTMDVCNYLSSWFCLWPFDVCVSICICMAQWIWGRKYNFLHNRKDETVPRALLESETRDYEDAGLLLNSPYFSVLREERDIDLIISLDFSDGDPFMTVREAAKMCKKLNISFPEVNIPSEDLKNPKDFYVFKGQNKTPTVIHIPLFNVVNCGDDIEDWRYKYHTFQGSYSAEMITDLMEVAGKNISNNREKLLEQIGAAVRLKRSRR